MVTIGHCCSFDDRILTQSVKDELYCDSDLAIVVRVIGDVTKCPNGTGSVYVCFPILIHQVLRGSARPSFIKMDKICPDDRVKNRADLFLVSTDVNDETFGVHGCDNVLETIDNIDNHSSLTDHYVRLYCSDQFLYIYTTLMIILIPVIVLASMMAITGRCSSRFKPNVNSETA